MNTQPDTLSAIIRRIAERKEEVILPAANRIYRYVIKKRKYSLLKNRRKGSNKLTHVAFFSRFNGGDILLPVMLRDLVEDNIGGLSWRKLHVHKVVNAKDVRRINAGKGLVIGGGGLFLKDTNPNQLSGWQWSCGIEELKKIKVPIALFAVGYNRFRGQGEFDPIFEEHLNLTTEKSIFIGLRNHGSIERVKAYLPENLHHKLRFQPCMTTIAAKLYPDLVQRPADTPPFISLNCAFDRSNLRFGEAVGQILSDLALAMKALSERVQIHYYAHSQDDEHFLPFLNAHGVDFELVKLYNCTPQEVVEAYSKPLVALGMRGHAQLIPFGCARPILSLISHNKLRYFLDDIDEPDWGVEMKDPDFKQQVVDKVTHTLDNMEEAEASVLEKMENLWKISLENVALLKEGFKIS